VGAARLEFAVVSKIMTLIVKHIDVVNNENYGRTINQFLTWHVEPTLKRGKSCYEMENFRVLMVEMFDDERLRIIKLNGNCKMGIGFKNPKINPADVGKIVSMDLKEIKEISWIDDETDGNSAKVLIIRFNKDFWLLNFDFRYNKKDALQKLERAREFFLACNTLIRKKDYCSNVMVYLIWACSELILDTKLFLMAKKPQCNHDDRKKKLQASYKSSFSDVFKDLFDRVSAIKNLARYAYSVQPNYNKVQAKKDISVLKNELSLLS